MIEDVKDWKNKLNDKEKHFLTNILRFFTQGDVDVAGGYVKNYLPYFPQPEVRMMLTGFAAREALHVAAYSHLIETLGMPESTYNDFLEYEEMRAKHDYFLSIAGQDASTIAQQIAAFSAFTEGMQLFSSFIMLLNFPRHGKMKGMGQIITWSIVDETIHAESMIKLFRTFVEENRDIWKDELKSEIYTIAERMVELEDKFIDLSFSLGAMEGLDAEDVKRYIRYICDRRLISLGLKGIFKVKKNPLPWVEEMINAPTHTNFFENRATDYAKGALSGDWGDVWAKAA
jgi:ribonucleoside-diphosphate reductase beta chain